MLRLILVTIAIYGASAVLQIKAPCPKVKPVANFDIYKHTQSKWYEIARYPLEVEGRGDCVVLNFFNETNMLRWNISEVIDGQVSYYSGYFNPAAAKAGLIEIYSTNFTQEEVDDMLTLYPLDIDYENYAVIYGCRYNDATETRHDYLWIFSRRKTLEGKPRIAMENYVKSSDVIDMDKLIWGHFTNETCKSYV